MRAFNDLMLNKVYVRRRAFYIRFNQETLFLISGGFDKSENLQYWQVDYCEREQAYYCFPLQQKQYKDKVVNWAEQQIQQGDFLRLEGDPLQGMVWIYLGSGSGNNCFVSNAPYAVSIGKQHRSGYWVKKKQKKIGDLSDMFDQPERLLRLWKELYGHLGADYLAYVDVHGDAIFPFFQEEPTASQMIDEMIRLYLEKRRILLDGCGDGNIKCDQQGRGACVDLGAVVKLRRGSGASDLLFGSNALNYINDYWLKYATIRSERLGAIQVTVAMLYLEQCFTPDCIRNDYIDRDILSVVAMAIRYEVRLNVRHLDELVRLKQVNMLQRLLPVVMPCFLKNKWPIKAGVFCLIDDDQDVMKALDYIHMNSISMTWSSFSALLTKPCLAERLFAKAKQLDGARLFKWPAYKPAAVARALAVVPSLADQEYKACGIN